MKISRAFVIALALGCATQIGPAAADNELTVFEIDPVTGAEIPAQLDPSRVQYRRRPLRFADHHSHDDEDASSAEAATISAAPTPTPTPTPMPTLQQPSQQPSHHLHQQTQQQYHDKVRNYAGHEEQTVAAGHPRADADARDDVAQRFGNLRRHWADTARAPFQRSYHSGHAQQQLQQQLQQQQQQQQLQQQQRDWHRHWWPAAVPRSGGPLASQHRHVAAPASSSSSSSSSASLLDSLEEMRQRLDAMERWDPLSHAAALLDDVGPRSASSPMFAGALQQRQRLWDALAANTGLLHHHRGGGVGVFDDDVMAPHHRHHHPLAVWSPKIDIVETDDAFVWHAELPGVDQKDVKVRVQGKTLEISGKRASRREAHGDNGRLHRVESSSGSFHRAFALPQGADPSTVSASFNGQGVLEVTCRKVEPTKTFDVPVKASQD
jgi:HSP20 family protein